MGRRKEEKSKIYLQQETEYLYELIWGMQVSCPLVTLDCRHWLVLLANAMWGLRITGKNSLNTLGQHCSNCRMLHLESQSECLLRLKGKENMYCVWDCICNLHDGFSFQNNQCIPAGLENYYSEQDSNARGKFYTVINHYNLAKQTITRSVSPWMTVLSEEKLSEQETEAAEKSA